MRPVARALLSALLVTTFALAGCAGGDDNGGGNGTTTTSKSGTGTTTSRAPGGGGGGGGGGTTSGPSGGGGGGGGSGENHAPTGSISASIQQGPIPVLVTFDLQGTDQDGDALTWNLDLDGDGNTDKSGTVLPASETYNYTTEGSFNVTFVISDGDASATYVVTINATAAVGGSGPLFQATGSYQIGGFENGCANWAAGPSLWYAASNPYQVNFALPATTIGHDFTAEYAVAGPAPAAGYALIFEDDAAALTESYQGDASPLTGTVPDATVGVRVSSCGGSDVTVTFTVT